MRRVVVVAVVAGALVAAGTFTSSCVGYLDDDEDCTGRRQYAQAVVADNPLVYLRFGEKANATVARDEMGSVNGTYPTSGIELGIPGALQNDCNKAVDLDAGPPGISMPQSVDFDGPDQQFSVEVWIRLDIAPSGTAFILDHEGFSPARGGWDLLLTPDQLNMEIWIDGAAAGVAYVMGLPSLGTWHYVVGEFDGTTNTMWMWIDHVRVFKNGVAGGSLPKVGGWSIGTENSSCTAQYFTGSIDELAIYGKLLDQGTIDQHWTLSGRQ